MKIYIGSDHAGYDLKEKIKTYLPELGLGYEVIDKGPVHYDEDDDYPDFIRPVAEAVSGDEGSFGIILGGSGQGEAIVANRVPGVRAVVFYGEMLPQGAVDINGDKSVDSFEIVKLEREHNNANVLSIGVRFVSDDAAKFASELFLKTEFSNDARHVRRINKIDKK